MYKEISQLIMYGNLDNSSILSSMAGTALAGNCDCGGAEYAYAEEIWLLDCGVFRGYLVNRAGTGAGIPLHRTALRLAVSG